MRYLLFILTLLPAIAHAQPAFGPEAGIGLATMHFAPDVGFTSASSTPIFSFKLGGLADLKITKHTYFQAGLFFSRRGQSRDYSFYASDSNNTTVQQDLMLSYFDVPVALVYKRGTQGRGRVTLGLGVTPSYLVGGRNKLHAQGAYSDTAYNYSVSKTVVDGNTVGLFDIGVSLSAGYELPTGLFFRLYYTGGVRDIGLGTQIDKNRMFGISAGYLFGKGRNINKEKNELIDNGTN